MTNFYRWFLPKLTDGQKFPNIPALQMLKVKQLSTGFLLNGQQQAIWAPKFVEHKNINIKTLQINDAPNSGIHKQAIVWISRLYTPQKVLHYSIQRHGRPWFSPNAKRNLPLLHNAFRPYPNFSASHQNRLQEKTVIFH